MKRSSRFTLALAGGAVGLLAAGSAVFAAAPSSSSEPVQLSLLDNSIKGGKNERAAVWIEDELIPAFEAEMEAAGTPVEVSFEGQGVDDEDYKTQMALDLGSGEGPDVMSIDGIWVGEFATAEYIRPLTDVVGPEVEEWDGWAQINEAVQANGMFEGARYGIPQGTDGRVIYFNKEIFAAAGLPEDWQPTTDRGGPRSGADDQGSSARTSSRSSSTPAWRWARRRRCRAPCRCSPPPARRSTTRRPACGPVARRT